MQFVKSWLLSLCFAALAGALVHLLAPEGATRHSMKVIVSLFLLLSLCRPLARVSSVQIRPSLPASVAISRQAQPLESMAQRQAAAALERTVQSVLSRELGARQINFLHISVATDILDNGSISITQVCVSLPALQHVDAGAQGELEAAIYTETGLHTSLQFQ